MQEAVFALTPSPNLSPKGGEEHEPERMRNMKACAADQRGCGRQDRSSDIT